ncbi:hypothetical protein H8959_000690 [Pygathrix nigripes]
MLSKHRWWLVAPRARSEPEEQGPEHSRRPAWLGQLTPEAGEEQEIWRSEGCTADWERSDYQAALVLSGLCLMRLSPPYSRPPQRLCGMNLSQPNPSPFPWTCRGSGYQ